jgi:VWFA-related protein
MTSQESPTTFKVNVHLVEVHVVVRDANGKAVGTLKKDDFKIFDNGKPQIITKFDVELPGQRVAEAEKSSEPSSASARTATAGSSVLPDLPERYIAYLFDDIHIASSDLMAVREAAQKNLATLQPTDRAGIFTTSGQNELDFTDDQNRLREALSHLTTHAISSKSPVQCPKMSYYIADLMQNKDDQRALTAVTEDALVCAFQGDRRMQIAAQNLAKASASQALATGETETRLAVSSLKDVVRRLAAAPGQRSIILISPGFIAPQHEYEVDDVIDRAVHANVTVSALDARGPYVVIPGGDASERGVSNPMTMAVETEYQTASASADADIMAELADSTGGSFFHNSNDLVRGFRQLATTPEYFYILGVSPQNLKLDGRFHKLKVALNTRENYALQARRGYFASRQPPGSDQQAKQEIEDAVFSQEEIHELPIDLHTQFFKLSDTDAKLTVLAHVDVNQLHFQKENGRNNDDLTIVSVIFDRNGNYVTGIEKTLQLHLKDDTLASKLGSGLSLKSNFDLRPGGYLVRLVVRDAQGQMAAENGAVEIP